MNENEKKVYTLNDIAKELGVNKSTVSKAISGKGSLSAGTRAKILDFVNECGYRPNALAQSLAQNKTYNIGLMVPDGTGVFDVDFFRNCLHGVCNVAAANNYDVLLTLGTESSLDGLSRLIDNRKIDGVIAMRSLVKSPIIPFIKEKQVPFVLIGSTSDKKIVSVDNDNRTACEEMTRRIIEGGAKRMAILGGDENHLVTHSRLNGFFDACDKAGLAREDQEILLNLCDNSAVSDAVDSVISLQTDCIVCMDDYICNMVMMRLHDCGVSVPHDVKTVSFYDNVLLEGHLPPISAIRFDSLNLGETACRKLIKILNGENTRNKVLSGYKIIMRESTK